MPKKQTSTSTKKKPAVSKTRSKISSKTSSKAHSITNDIENIREKAYFLWAEKGYPENSDIDNWLEAEKQLCN